jgi:hypothetical protein
MNGRWNTIASRGAGAASARRPSLSGSSPCMARSSVLLPDPFAPTSATRSPRVTMRSTWLTARLTPKHTLAPFRAISGSLAATGRASSGVNS